MFFCDQTTAGGGWTVSQKRVDGTVDFFLKWSDYKQGFGDLSGGFWLGSDKIHRLTSDNNNRLRVDLEDFEGNKAYAEYDMFGVMSENDKCKLILGSYSGMLHCERRTRPKVGRQTEIERKGTEPTILGQGGLEAHVQIIFKR